MMRVGRISIINQLPSDSKNHKYQKISEGNVSFSDILSREYQKVNSKENQKESTPVEISTKDEFQMQDNMNPNGFIGLYNNTARLYVETVMGSMQYRNIEIPIDNETEDYDAVEGVFKSNRN